MSTFGDIPSPAKSAIDAATRVTRAKQTPEVLNQRAVPRLSIDELNEMSLEDLHDKYLTARRDDRGPVETTLDFLDAPRNAILGALAPGLRAKAEAAGNRGAFGLGRVNAADVLGEAGFKPGIVRGVLGFIGDVALDPLTYAGPPGWGARATTAGGRTIRTGAAGVRAIKRAERTGEATGVVKGLADAAGGTKGLRTAVFGGLDAGSGGKVKAAVNRVGRWMGGEEERSGGLLADLADKYTTTDMAPEATAAFGKRIEARDAFVSHYSAGAGPAAIKIGLDASGKLKVRFGVPRGTSEIKATSSLAHIPFTDISLLSVPAISRDAIAAATDIARAATTGQRIGVSVEDAIRKSPRVIEIVGHTNAMRQTREGLRGDLATRAKFRADNAAALDLARGSPELDRNKNSIWIQDQALSDSITSRSQSARELSQRVADIRRQVDDHAVPMTVGEMLYLKDRANVFSKEAAAMADELAGIEEKAKVRNALQTEQNAHIERSMDTIRRFAEHDETARGSSSDGYAARSFLGFNPARPFESVVSNDLNLVGQVSEEARPLLDQYDDALNELVKAKPGKDTNILFAQDIDGPKVDALRDRVNTLRDRLHEVTAPLRTGTPATLQEVEESIRTTANARLGEQKKALQDIMEATPDQRADDKIMADVLRDSITATMDANLAARLSPIAHMTPEQMQVLKLHKDFLGASDGLVGMAAMQLPRKMAEYVHGGRDGLAVQLVDKIDAMMRKGFGGPPSQVGDMARHVRFMSGEGAQLEAARLLLDGRRKLATLAAKHNLQGRENELAKMATAVWVADHEARAGTKLFRDVDAAGQRVGVYRVLDDATKNPAAAIPLTPELHADLRVLAEDAKLFESMRDQSVKAGILSRFDARDEYFPNTLTPQARRYMQVAAKSADGGAAAHARQLAIQSFEKARTHDSAVFMSRTTGKMEEVFNADRWAQTLSDAEIDRIGHKDLQTKARNLKALLDEYDRIPNPPPMLMNDPERMNQLAASGKFAALGIAGDLPGGFMDSNLYASMMRRLMDQERAIARESFLKEVIGGQAIPFKNSDLSKLASHPPGTAVDLGNGVIAKTVKLGDNQTGIKVGDDIFRTLKGKATDYENPLIQLMGGDGAVGALYHQHTAEAIEKAAAVSTDPEFLKAIDFLTHVWKTGNLAHPAWMMANMIGDSLNFAAQDAGYIPAAIKFGKSALRMIWHAREPEQLAKIKFNLNGADVDGNQVMRVLRGEPIFDAAIFNEPAIRAARQEDFLGSRLQPLGAALSKQGISSDYSQALRTSLEADPSVGAYAKVKAGASVASDRAHRTILEPWWRVNQKASEWIRLIAYLSQREQSVDHGGAVQRVIRAGFDYCVDDETEILTDRGWLKYNEVLTTDRAWSINPKTGISDFVPIVAVNVFDNKRREMWKVKSTRFNALVTNGHTWICAGSGVVGGHWSTRDSSFGHMRKTEDVAGSCSRIVAGGGEYLGPECAIYSDEFVRLVGWVVTEGSFLSKKNSSGVVLSQSVKHNPDHVREIECIASHYRSSGATVSRYERDVGWGTIATFYFGKGIGKTIREACPNKQITAKFLLSLTAKQLRLLFDVMMSGDGHVGVRGARSFTQKDVGRINGFQMLCAMLGIRTYSKINPTNGVSRIAAYRSTEVYADGLRWDRVVHHGLVWCPTTKSGTWYARRRGCTYWTGNTNLTDTERKIFRRAFPFWAWLKNNAIYQTKLLLERPIFAGSLPLLQRAVEEAVDGESRVPINQRPRWMREQIALQLGEDPESRAALLIGNLLPQEQAFLAGRLTQGISGAQSVLNQAVSSLNPIGRSVIELGAGREFYSGRTIGATGDVSPVGYVADQLIPRAIREIPKVARTTGEIGAVGGAARVAFGGRVQPMSDERIRIAKSREFQEEEDRLRKSIRTAEFRKDAARSLVKRAELLRLYGDMVSQGFDADVPKWAKARLAQFAS